MPEKESPKEYIILRNLNRRVYFFGFPPNVLMLAGMGIMFDLIISLLFRQYYFLILIIPVLWVSFVIRGQHEKGNPDYIQSWDIKRKSPKYLVDSTQLLKKI